MTDRIKTSISGQITFVKDYVNSKNQAGKTYTLSFMGGKFYNLFLDKNLGELVNGDKGIFDIELKLTELKDDGGFKKTAYVPVSIIDFAADVKSDIKKPAPKVVGV